MRAYRRYRGYPDILDNRLVFMCQRIPRKYDNHDTVEVDCFEIFHRTTTNEVSL